MNIVEVKGLYYNPLNSHLFILQKEIEGIDLDKYIRKYKRCNEDKAKIIFKQILSAIDYIHGKGICHRDIKPDNIMIVPDTLHVTIADFNVSKDFSKLKIMNTHTGTLSFSAPEILFKEEYT